MPGSRSAVVEIGEATHSARSAAVCPGVRTPYLGQRSDETTHTDDS
ncbi:MAG: hypothetical protein V7646_7987 [Pseudonocardia sp.]